MPQEAEYDGRNLVFIIGSARSGTTHFQKLLASNPRIRTGQETHLFRYIAPSLRTWKRHLDSGVKGQGVLGLPCYLNEETFVDLTKKYTLSLMESMIEGLQEGEIFLEKTPDHLSYVDEILRLFPESKFIHMLRDGRAVVASLLAASRSFGKRWAPKNARLAARSWRDSVEESLNARKGIKESNFHEVRFEDLISSPKRILKETANFLEIKWSDEDVQRAIEDNTVEKARMSRKMEYSRLFNPEGELAKRTGGISPAKDDSFIRQGKTESWKSELGPLDRFWVWFVARKTLQKVGYN